MYPLLTKDEIKRNVLGDDRLYVREGYQGYGLLKCIYDDAFEKDQEVQLDGKMFNGMSGRVLHSSECTPVDGEFMSPVQGLKTIYENRVICVR